MLLVFILLIIVLEGPGILQRRQWKEILMVFTMVILSTAYGVDYIFQLSILPDPKVLIYQLLPPGEFFKEYFHTQF